MKSFVLAIGLAIALVGCTDQETEQTRKKLQDAGQQLKHDADVAQKAIKDEADKASREIQKQVDEAKHDVHSHDTDHDTNKDTK